MLAKPQMWWPGINWQHAHARGLVGAWALWDGAGSSTVNLLTGEVGDLSAGAVSAVWAGGGIGNVVSHQNINCRTTLFVDSSVLSTTDVTIFLRYRKRDSTNRKSGGFGVDNSIPGQQCGTHVPWDDGIVYWDFGDKRLSKSGLVFGDDLWCFIHSKTRNEQAIWQNGGKVASQTTTTSRAVSTEAYQLGGHVTVKSDLADYGVFYVWNVGLPDFLIRSLFGDPFAMLRIPSSARRHVPEPVPRLEIVQDGNEVRVRATQTGSATFFHWYLDGVWAGRTNVPENTFYLAAGETVEVALVATSDAAFDPHAAPPIGYPARRRIEWTRSGDTVIDHYRLEFATGQGAPAANAWTAFADHLPDTGLWLQSALTPQLDDDEWYWFRVVPVNAAGNDGTVTTIGPLRSVRRPAPPDVDVSFDDATQLATYAEV